jgi:hypothetical protein
MGSVVNLMVGPPYAQGQIHRYPIMRPGGPQYWYGRFADQINFLPRPHVAIRLMGRAAHSQLAKQTSTPATPKRCAVFRMSDVTSNPVLPKRCSVSYIRRNFEPGSSETLCSVSYVTNFEPGSSETLCSVSYARRNFEPGSSETLCCFVC